MKIKFWFLLLFCAVQVFSQPADLQSEVKKLYTACHDIDITALSDMLCSSDGEIYEKLDAHFLNDQQKFRYVFTNAKYNYDALKTIDGKSYYAINFRNVVRITYFNPIDVSEKQLMLKEKFKAQTVVYEKARNSFMITYNAKMVAISESGNWKFAFADQTMPPVSDTCLSESVKKEFGL